MTIKEAVAYGLTALNQSSDAPALDVERLLLNTFQQHDASWLITHDQEELSQTQEKKYIIYVKERASGKPLAYILGTWEFYGREFTISPEVLVPRPDTEHLITRALLIIARLSTQKKRTLIIADIGTGSGCIAVTLALESPDIKTIFATDISPTALAVAKKNAEAYKVTEKIQFLQGNMLEPIKHQDIDLIVSNPPYVPTDELQRRPTSATIGLMYEPKIALDGGPDGLLFIKQIQDSGIPAIIETVGGNILSLNLASNTKKPPF